MSYEITGNRHMGAAMKKKQQMINEWKVKARRKILPGYPIEEPFKTREEVDNYLNSDRLTCLLCGKTYKSLCAHLLVHGTHADDYKEKYGLPFGCGLTCVSTKAMNVKHGKRLVEDGIFRPPTPEEHKHMIATMRKPRNKPAYAITEGTLRVTGRQPERLFKDSHYWEVLEIARKNKAHPTDVCKQNKGILPGVSRLHDFKKSNEEFKKHYEEVIEGLPIKVQLRHLVVPESYVKQIKELREQGLTNAEVARIMGVHEITIEKYNKKLSLKKPPKTTCGNGLHPYPGFRKPCKPCNLIQARNRNGTMDRQISKTIKIERPCSGCGKSIEATRLVGAKRVKYCKECKVEKDLQAQRKYAKEKRPLLKQKDSNDS